jgi:hypothetical protein
MKVRGYVKKTLHLQGVSRHTKDEIISFIDEAALSLSILVGDRGFIQGKAMNANACLFGFLITIYNGPLMCVHWHKAVEKYPNLRTWTEGMAEKYFPERKVLTKQDVRGNRFLKLQ